MSSTSNTARLKPDLGPRMKFIVGCLGGLVAGAGGYALTFDQGTLNEITWFVGAALRVILFSAAGGLWVWLNVSETNRMSVFQSGMVAPAALTAMIAASGTLQAADMSQTAAFKQSSGLATTLAVRTLPVSTASLFFQRNDQDAGNDRTIQCIVSGFLGRRC